MNSTTLVVKKKAFYKPLASSAIVDYHETPPNIVTVNYKNPSDANLEELNIRQKN